MQSLCSIRSHKLHRVAQIAPFSRDADVNELLKSFERYVNVTGGPSARGSCDADERMRAVMQAQKCRILQKIHE